MGWKVVRQIEKLPISHMDARDGIIWKHNTIKLGFKALASNGSDRDLM